MTVLLIFEYLKSVEGYILECTLNTKILVLGILLLIAGCGTFERAVLENKRQVQRVGKTMGCIIDEPIHLISKEGISLETNHELDLYELLDLAFTYNPLTKIAWSRAAIASAQKTKTESAFYPRATVSLNAARIEQMGGMSADGKHMTTSLSNVIYPQVEINYSLLKFGAHKELSYSALNALRAENFQFNQTLQNVAYALELAYFGLDSAIATVHANEQNLRDTKVALDAVESRHQSGLANKQDLLKAQAAHSAAVFNLESSRSSVEAARAQLAKAIGIQVNKNLRIVESKVSDVPNVGDIELLIMEALKMRQDIQASRENLASREHALNSRKCDQYPELVTGIRVSRKKIQHVPGMYNNFEAYVGLKWDIFDGYLKMSEQLAAYEEMKIARQQLELKALDIVSQVWEYFYALKSAVHKLDSAKKAENCALEAFNYTREAYANGLSSFTDLLTSQNVLSVARKQLVYAKNDLALGWVRLVYCTGRILEK